MTADVILIHGLGRTARIMDKMADYLTSEGYQVYNLDYPSTQYSINTLVDHIAAQIVQCRTDPSRQLNMIAMSLGSILIHLYIQKYRPEQLGRVVALGPPYHGSEIVDHLKKYTWYQKIYGPAGLELTTEAEGIWHRLSAVDYELGIIAGDRWIFFDWFFSRFWLPRPNDGKVSVASTRIKGYRDHIVLPVNHVFMPHFSCVIRQAAWFLKQGCFQRGGCQDTLENY